MDRIIEKLNQIEFHDVPVEALHFQIYPTTFIIDFALHDDNLDDYNYFQISFIDIQKLETNGGIFFDERIDLEITTFDYAYKHIFEGKLGLLSENCAYFEVTFVCKNVELKLLDYSIYGEMSS